MPRNRSLTILLVALVAALSTHLAFRLLEGLRADLTEQNIYSLSDGTLELIEKMQAEGAQPLEMKLYFSEKSGKTLPRFIKDFITYERYLRHLLRSYERAAEGKIAVSFVDPLTDSDEAIAMRRETLDVSVLSYDQPVPLLLTIRNVNPEVENGGFLVSVEGAPDSKQWDEFPELSDLPR